MRELIGHAMRLLVAIYKSGHGYRKSGVILLGLQPLTGETQRLFDDVRYQKDRQLMDVIDGLNDKYGRQTVRFGMPAKQNTHWQMNRNYLSPNFTTDIDQILKIRN